MKEFCDMTRKEKKDFLSMDFADRMIRIEQRVSSSFNKPLSYDKTNFFKSLTPCQREKFQKYLGGKSRRKLFLGFFLIMPVLLLYLLNNPNLTGNFIKGSLDPQLNFLVSSILVCLGIIFLALIIILLIRKKIRDRRFKKNSKILDDIIINKGVSGSRIQKHKKHKKTQGI